MCIKTRMKIWEYFIFLEKDKQSLLLYHMAALISTRVPRWTIVTQVFILEPNGDHHVNHEEILYKNSGGDIKKKFENFYA